MKTITLKDKITEAFLKRDNIEEKDLNRIVENFLKRRYAPEKISKVANDLLTKYDFKALAEEIKRRNLLNSYVDSVVLSKIREWYKASNNIDISTLDEAKFCSLVFQVMQHFGYTLLYVPGTVDTRMSAIFHRQDSKVAVFTCKTDNQVKVGIMVLRQLKYLADYYNCEQSLLVTNGYFDDEVHEEAAKNGITLLDIDKFMPLIIDLVENKKKAEKQILIQGISNRNSFYLESIIKSPKAKVQANFINYTYDAGTNTITFEGEISNSGKRPVTSLNVEISLFNRYESLSAKKTEPAFSPILDGGETSAFKVSFENISEDDCPNLCRYEIKFDYSNSYVTTPKAAAH